ncbi:MAG: NAD(P)-binding protein [Clostridiales Family XIII bacterium]|jgi:Fe-S oxidoreductase|nr:NAD(P)-binding protein [Clostridiales Family XIII bacterium]
MDEYTDNFGACLQKEAPFCGAECPFHMDVPDFVEKIRKGMWNAAFKVYRNATGFPHTAAALCRAPCRSVCPLADRGGAVDLPLLERACLAFAKDKGATGYNVPAKRGRIAIVGAGVSGLACALRLSAKKYGVEVFARGARLGGKLRDILPPDLFLRDIEEQFRYEEYVLHASVRVPDRDFLNARGFDAVYVATGAGGDDFGLPVAGGENGRCLRDGPTAWFAGGALIGEEGARALAGGLYMGTIIDNFLKTDKPVYPPNKAQTRMVLDAARLIDTPPVAARNGAGYTEDEAREEALRCLKCQCDACKLYVDLCAFTGKWPLRIRDEIAATTLPGVSEVKATPAKRLLSASNLARVCREICPARIDLEGLILEGRRSMHRQDKAPWVFHDFWLRDMAFADGPEAALCRAPAGAATCAQAFFPGCQLGAGDPGLVEAAYAGLLARHPDTALFLRCCGAPAEWAGDTEKHAAALDAIRAAWRALGEPLMLFACPSCMEAFARCIPEMPQRSIYEALAESGAGGLGDPGPGGGLEGAGGSGVFEDLEAGGDPGVACDPGAGGPGFAGPLAASARADAARGGARGEWAVFDPCAARRSAGMKSAVRRLAEAAGCALAPLTEQERVPRCCGYGGQPAVADPAYAAFVAEKRASESERPYIAYCSNCRDALRRAGKECLHILEILFARAPAGDANARLATVTERRRNRVALKRTLLERYWNEKPAPPAGDADGADGPRILIGEALLAQMDADRILEEEVREVVAFCERTGRKVLDADSGAYGGYKKIGRMSYWVEYRPLDGGEGLELLRAYAHRMEIALEAVWNGVKQDVDL